MSALDLRGHIEAIEPLPPLYAKTRRIWRVRVWNKSEQQWAHDGTHRVSLTCRWRRDDGSNAAHEGAGTLLPSALAAGASADVALCLSCPPEPGSFTLEVLVVAQSLTAREGLDFHPSRVSCKVLPLAEEAAGRVTILQSLDTLVAGDRLRVAVRYENLSRATWNAAGIAPLRFVLHWQLADGQVQPSLSRRQGVDSDLLPGSTYELAMDTTVPATAGRWLLHATAERELSYVLHSCEAFAAAVTPVVVQVDDRSPGTRSMLRLPRERAHREAADSALHPGWLRANNSLAPDECIEGNTTVHVIVLGHAGDELRKTRAALREQRASKHLTIYATSAALELEAGESCSRISPDTDRAVALMAAVRQLQAHARDLVLVIDAGDTLETFALALLSHAATAEPDRDGFTFDEDNRSAGGGREAPIFRPLQNQELALSWPLLSARAAIRFERLASELSSDPLGAFQLCTIAHTDALSDGGYRFRHLPHILLCRGLGGQALDHRADALFALAAHLNRRDSRLRVEPLFASGGLRIRWPLPNPPPRVTIIIATKDMLPLVRRCVESVRLKTDYPSYDILVVDHETTEPRARAYLDALTKHGDIELVGYTGAFNWAKMNNLAAREAKGEVVVFLNNDTEVLHEGWLREIVSHVVRPKVGAVGAMLLFGDNTIQHAGVYSDFPAIGHIGSGRHFQEALPPSMCLVNETTAVTGACLAVERARFLRSGGFDEHELPIGYNDVEFCLRMRRDEQARTVFTPHAVLAHHESATRGKPKKHEAFPRNAAGLLSASYREVLKEHPFASPHTSWREPDVALARSRVHPRQTFERLALRASRQPRLYFVHIPKTAGVALRAALETRAPARVGVLDGRENLLIAHGDARAIADARGRSQESSIWFSHFRFGIDKLLDQPGVYATILRRPIDRLRSHFDHLRSGAVSPLYDTALATCSLLELLRGGVLQPNLMTRMLCGGPSETITWPELAAAHRTRVANFVGFDLPPSAWLGEARLAANKAPDDDLKLLERAWSNIQEHFAFVGRLESLGDDLAALSDALGWERPMLETRNTAQERSDVKAEERAEIEAYVRLDSMLYDRIASLPEGRFLSAQRLQQTAAFRPRSIRR